MNDQLYLLHRRSHGRRMSPKQADNRVCDGAEGSTARWKCQTKLAVR
jgi:hypothetical protein